MTSSEKENVTHTPVFEPFEQPPWSQHGQTHSVGAFDRPKTKSGTSAMSLNILRDNFTISTWLLLGASLQCGLVWVFGARLWIVSLPVLVLGMRCIKTILQAAGVLKNPYMEGVVPGRTTCHFPDKDGSYEGSPSNKSVAVLLISARSNHALGMLGPGFKEAGEFFGQCVKWLEEDAEGRGFLGMTQWLNCGDRTASNELLLIGYFRSVEDIHGLAHHAVHRAPWKWWNESKKKLDHITLTHEIFSCDAGNWENIFINSKPTHMGSSVVKGGDGKWRSPLIYVSAAHRSSANRLRRKQTRAEQQRQEETDTITGEVY
ncbi:uncharacterized protein UTRI_03879 [Ustilago trichophora]|uniref:Uncharacterized protein n=1 Tax=Ustilago trichophora TaxID=86804 RepID=A0A5C3E3B9_9BASI|nr:uncharacterized protein UTRI_03879 [Ustilago trichophora]